MHPTRMVLALCALAVSSAAQAAPSDVTLGSEVKPLFRDGVLEGCTASFQVAHQDAEYAHGDYVLVVGSLIYLTSGLSPYFALKLGVQPTVSGEFHRPDSALLVSGNNTNKADAFPTLSGEPGFGLFRFRASPNTTKMAIALADGRRFQLGYAPERAGLLSVVDVDFSIQEVDLDRPEASKRTPNAGADWRQCMSDATKAAVARAKLQ